MQGNRFEPTLDGRLELLVTGRGGTSPGRTYGVTWQDTSWRVRWQFDSGALLIAPCLNDSGVQMLVYATQPNGTGPGPFYMAFVEGDSVTPPDSIDVKYNANILTVGAQGPSFRWAAVTDLEEGSSRELLKLYSKPIRAPVGTPWRRLRTPFEIRNASGVYASMVARGESTCVVVWYDGSNESPGLSWGVVNDTGWVREPELVQWFGPGDRPVMRTLESGALMVMYGNRDSVTVRRTLRDTTWSGLVAQRWSFPSNQPLDRYLLYSADMSLDPRPLPVLSASSYNSRNGSMVAHVAVPDSGRYGRGEWVPGSWGALIPFVARDENGDVWLSWSQFYDGTFWLHTYSTTTCSAPTLAESAGSPRVGWTLSTRTPESAWRVMRSQNGGPYEPLERVVAGDGLDLVFVDRSAPSGARLRYRVRRECRDTRYLWESEPSSEWLPRTQVLGLRSVVANPADAELRYELTGAGAGPLELRALDLQGRVVLRRRFTAAGLGRDVLSVGASEAARLRPGLYFVQVRASGGAESRAVKVAIVR